MLSKKGVLGEMADVISDLQKAGLLGALAFFGLGGF